MRLLFILLTFLTSTIYGGNYAKLAESEPIAVNPIPKSIKSNSNFYTGLGFGVFKLKDRTTKESLKANIITLIAGYRINNYLSIEARASKSIEDLKYKKGSTNNQDEKLDIDYTNLSFYLKPNYQFNNFNAYLLLGYNKLRVSKLLNYPRSSKSISYGAGFGYKINRVDVALEYLVNYNKKGLDNLAIKDKIKITHINLNITYNF